MLEKIKGLFGRQTPPETTAYITPLEYLPETNPPCQTYDETTRPNLRVSRHKTQELQRVLDLAG